MDKKEFSIAMHLIKKKLQGYELPKVLPASLKADPIPVIGSFAQPTIGAPVVQPMGMGFPMGGKLCLFTNTLSFCPCLLCSIVGR